MSQLRPLRAPVPWALALLLAVVALPALAATPATKKPATSARSSTPALASSRRMLARLEASGRAVTAFEHTQPDPLGEGRRRQRGTLAIEPPDRTRLDFASGESVALRSDGGEWLQPELHQMLRLGPGHAESARRWWSLLLPGAAARFSERSLGGNRYLVIARDEGAADSAWVTLGADALPSALRFRGVDGEFVEVRFLEWSFAKPRGARAFVLEAPAGVSVIDLE